MSHNILSQFQIGIHIIIMTDDDLVVAAVVMMVAVAMVINACFIGGLVMRWWL